MATYKRVSSFHYGPVGVKCLAPSVKEIKCLISKEKTSSTKEEVKKKK